MKDLKTWVLLLMFGSLWGFSEVFAGEFLYSQRVPFASVWLSAFALFILGLSRGLINKPGSSTAIGATAALFKLMNAAPYWCHLLGIAFLGLVFDLAASAWMKRGQRPGWKTVLSGIVTAYGGYASFAVLITYVARYDPWVRGGTARILRHILVGGSLAAVAAAITVTLGYVMGTRTEKSTPTEPGWAFAGSLVVLIALWTLGRVIG
jgi:drug/metabolite transporter (DMT)-like permease